MIKIYFKNITATSHLICYLMVFLPFFHSPFRFQQDFIYSYRSLKWLHDYVPLCFFYFLWVFIQLPWVMWTHHESPLYLCCLPWTWYDWQHSHYKKYILHWSHTLQLQMLVHNIDNKIQINIKIKIVRQLLIWYGQKYFSFDNSVISSLTRINNFILLHMLFGCIC